MSLHPQEIAPVPKETCLVARAVIPGGTVYIRLREELGAIYDGQLFAPLCSACGLPTASSRRLALTTVMQFAEGLSDRRAAAAVRIREALSIDLRLFTGHHAVDPGALLRERKVGQLAHIESPITAKGHRGGHGVHEELCARWKAKGRRRVHGHCGNTARDSMCPRDYCSPMACRFIAAWALAVGTS
jgi:hypothetical protein